MTGWRVDLDLLDAHARQVRTLSERARRAGAGGRPLDLGGYGLVGQVFAIAAAQAADAGSAAVARLAARATAHAEQVRAAAQDYRQLERDVTVGFGGAR